MEAAEAQRAKVMADIEAAAAEAKRQPGGV